MVYTSVICQGEMLALAEKNGWGHKKRTRLEQVLNGVPTLGISRRVILDAYARIDAWTHGQTVASPNNSPPPKPAVSMKQNDLWIAATAHASGATLLSTDTDFQHLDGIWFHSSTLISNTAFFTANLSEWVSIECEQVYEHTELRRATQ